MSKSSTLAPSPPPEGMLSLADLTAAIGLVARVKHLEGELLRTRDSARITAIYVQLDGHRWRLQSQYRIHIPSFEGRPGPVDDEPRTA